MSGSKGRGQGRVRGSEKRLVRPIRGKKGRDGTCAPRITPDVIWMPWESERGPYQLITRRVITSLLRRVFSLVIVEKHLPSSGLKLLKAKEMNLKQ